MSGRTVGSFDFATEVVFASGWSGPPGGSRWTCGGATGGAPRASGWPRRRPRRPAESGEEAIIANERARRLWQAIDSLPEKLRIVIVLAAIDGHGVREVASLLGLPSGTVKSRLFSARESLKERLR